MERAWWKEAAVYQIYPRSFLDSNGDGIGDINGITMRLDYLKALGVDVIWLSPVYESPDCDNGYDISDYRAIMKKFGTMEDFDRLLAEAHRRGLKIVMDLVVNHTSDEHRWFIESRASRDNPYRDYYIWRPGRGGDAPNNWGSIFGGSAWEYDEETEMYYLHLFAKGQPDLNWENPALRQEIYDMMAWWCEKGIDGFRMDVISMISKDQRFPDGAQGENELYGDVSPYVFSGPRVHEFLKEMNQKVLAKYDLMTVGETPGVTIEQAKRYAGEDTHELNMVFQFEHVEIGNGPHGKWTTQRYSMPELRAVMSKWQTALEGSAWNSLFWGNHDQSRCVSRFGFDRPEYRALSAKMLAACLYFMKGTPYIYQGDELGMTNNGGFRQLSDYRDLESINWFHAYTRAGLTTEAEMFAALGARSRDHARTPMQWDASPNAGFTTGEPWIMVNPNYTQINAAQQVNDPDSVFCFYQQLLRLRKQHDVFLYGTYELMLPDSEAIWAYRRTLGGRQAQVYCNFTTQGVPCETPREGLLLCNYNTVQAEILRPCECRVYLDPKGLLRS